MTTPPIPTIETARLLLRPATADDLDIWATRVFADPDVTRFLPSRVLDPRERAALNLAFFTENWTQHGHGDWLIVDKADGQLIGHCGLLHIRDTGEVEVDYALAQTHWGQGIATEAARASLRFGFEHRQLDRIIGLVVPENKASRRVLEHNGFVYQRDAHYFGLSLAYYELLRSQFRLDDSFYRLHSAFA